MSEGDAEKFETAFDWVQSGMSKEFSETPISEIPSKRMQWILDNMGIDFRSAKTIPEAEKMLSEGLGINVKLVRNDDGT